MDTNKKREYKKKSLKGSGTISRNYDYDKEAIQYLQDKIKPKAKISAFLSELVLTHKENFNGEILFK